MQARKEATKKTKGDWEAQGSRGLEEDTPVRYSQPPTSWARPGYVKSFQTTRGTGAGWQLYGISFWE